MRRILMKFFTTEMNLQSFFQSYKHDRKVHQLRQYKFVFEDSVQTLKPFTNGVNRNI